jgi:ribosomal protein S8
MWKLCEVRDDESQADEKLDQFCSHLAETCLTLVGIPFSILDKKTEKKMMAMRRQGLIDRIEKSNAQDEILSTCVALIYQQTKSMMISGSLMISLVLNKLFEEEKKIPKRATEVLFKLNQENGVSPELLILAKQFGIAKNNKALAAISDNSL